MAHDAFTAGVKPGGLNSSTEIRILLCYLMHSTPDPLSLEEIEQALLGEELVNYFELADSLASLCENGFAKREGDCYTLLSAGVEIAAALGSDVPRSVRDTAVRVALQAQRFARKAAQHKVLLQKTSAGYTVRCSMEENGSDVFSFTLLLPDLQSATFLKQQFIERGDTVYALLLAGATGNVQLAETALTALDREEVI